MKTIIILLLTINCFAFDIKFYHEIEQSFDTQELEGWNVNPDITYSFIPRGDGYSLKLYKEAGDKDYLFIMSRSYMDHDYGICLPESSSFSAFSYYVVDSIGVLKADVTLFKAMDYNKTDYITLTLPDAYSNMEDYLLGEKDALCVKKIVFYKENVKYPVSFAYDYIKWEDIYILDPEIPDFTEAYVGFDDYDDKVDMKLYFYYGHPSQVVDIYIAIYNDSGIFFFPSWSTKVEKITLPLIQFTSFYDWVYITTYNLDDLPFYEGTNYYTIALAPEGTFDWINEPLVFVFVR